MPRRTGVDAGDSGYLDAEQVGHGNDDDAAEGERPEVALARRERGASEPPEVLHEQRGVQRRVEQVVHVVEHGDGEPWRGQE